jgi:hypothetical protein
MRTRRAALGPVFVVAAQLAVAPLALACGSAAEPGDGDGKAAREGAEESPTVLATHSGEVRLGGGPATVRVPAAPQAGERLAAAGAAGDGSLWLQLEGLRLLRPGVYYQVYLDLPAGQQPDPKGPHFVGNLSLYGAKPGGAELEHSFDVTGTVRQLARQGRWTGEVSVTFVPGNRGETSAAGDFMTLRRIALVER